MKAQIVLLGNPVIVTDEEIKEQDGCWIIDFRTNAIAQNINNYIKVWNENCKKIISHNKPIDYNGIDFGIVDVEKLCFDLLGIPLEHLDSEDHSKLDFGITCFNASQQLNEKKFTLEEMRMAFEAGKKLEYWRNNNVMPNRFPNPEFQSLNEFTTSLSIPKTFNVEIEETPTNIKIIKKL